MARENGAELELIDLSDVPLELCLERDRKRQSFVGSGVIMDMYERYLAPKPALVLHDESLPKAVIVDIDGTIAKMNGRGPYEWEKVGTDLPRLEVWGAAYALAGATGAAILLVSGRDEGRCRAATEQWLGTHFKYRPLLYMRPADDMRRDSIIK